MTHASEQNVIDVIHGRTVRDPYRWLEAERSTSTQAWIEEQQRRANDYFKASDVLMRSERITQRFMLKDFTDQAVRVKGRLLTRAVNRGAQHAGIYVEEPNGFRRKLLDPGSFGPTASFSIYAVSDSSRFAALELRQTGTDTAEILMIDTFSGALLRDALPLGRSSGFVWAESQSGFFYCHEQSRIDDQHEVRFHRFGDNPSADVTVFFMPRRGDSRLALFGNERQLGLVYSKGQGDSSEHTFWVASSENPKEWTLVCNGRSKPFVPVFSGTRLFVLTAEGAPTRKIVEVFPTSAPPRDIVPACSSVILEFVPIADKLYLRYYRDGFNAIVIWHVDGHEMGSLSLPAPSCGPLTLGFIGPRSESSAFCICQSFTDPPLIYEWQSTDKEMHCTSSIVLKARPNRICHTLTVTYASRDCTPIQMQIFANSPIETSHARPFLLTAYGGFGSPESPRYSVALQALCDAGIAIAIPSIRGGGKDDIAWHLTAKGPGRQLSFDDFIAAAEWLISNGLTCPDELGLYGGSNGGLLVAVAMTQRPELFRAVVCMGPLLDMVRYEQFNHASKWRAEYGSVTNPDEFRALLRYSPYHNVHPNIDYPATLFVTGASDDRCHPSHVYKMAAILQNRAGQRRPIIVDYLSERGHRGGLPLALRSEAISRRVAFLVSELGVCLREGEK